MKYASIIALFYFCLVSCTPKPEEYFIKRILVGQRTIDTIKVIVEKKIQANSILFSYKTAFDTVSYRIDKKAKTKLKLVSPYFDADTIHLVKEYFIKIGSKNYKIDHFTASNGAIDSGVEFYWNEDLGMFFTRGRTWRNYSILQSTNENKNKVIWEIIKKVYPPINDQLLYLEQLKEEGLIIER
ncbi:hypothetical protein HUW51_10050 [Adhaeribacter swui]|uniref:Uncharacterized protein n=1 Tax=Adhaeribacter swui TaxID=2086471 RepID=A0A7G7G7C4_9BACT|nr:hypothetical protein [Adhaeribacter swui]QNF33058.1 hypothetical protein HUW51_10050 [Adhaeribacter swui]